MANDLFGGLGNLGGALGGLMGGLTKSGLIPTDTLDGKLFVAQSELSGLQKQESEILLEIGRQAYEQNPNAWPQAAKLKLIRQNIAAAQTMLDNAKQMQEQAEAAKGRCPDCGNKNPEGMKFCGECGNPLTAAAPKKCIACGAELAPGTRFCGACGARQEE